MGDGNKPTLARLPGLIWWLGAALGVPTVVGGALYGPAQRHWSFAGLLLLGYWAGLGMLRFTGSVFRELTTRWRMRLVDTIDRALLLWVSGFHRRYRRWMLSYLERVDLQGLATAPDSAPLLDAVYVDVSLVNRPRHRISGDMLSDRVTGTERLSITALLAESTPHVLAVIGAPGSGKTTLLRHAARETCLHTFGGRRTVPILIFLRDHAAAIIENPGISLPHRVLPTEGYPRPPDGWFEWQLSRGRCVVLLDGLDEVGQAEQHDAVRLWVERQIQAYPDNHFVITSRLHGYPTAAINKADVLQVRLLTTEQSAQFVKAWYHAVEADPAAATAQAQDLVRQIGSHSALHQLAVNPLLLTMMVNVHREREVLPGSRVQLYREICEVMLWRRKWAKKLTSTLSGARRQEILQRLALAMMERRIRDIPDHEAATVIAPDLARLDSGVTAQAFLTEVARDGLILKPNSGIVAFSHQTFQEYLASVELHDRGQVALLAANVDDDWWRETTVLYAAQFDADAVVAACLASQTVKALALAFDCTEQETTLAPELRAQMNALLAEVADADTDPFRHRLLTSVLLTRHLRHTIETVDDHRCIQPIPAMLYQLFLEDERTRGRDRTPDASMPKDPDDAATGVRGEDALALVDWINNLVDDALYRLPTAAEIDDLHGRGLLGPQPGCVWLDAPNGPPARWTRAGIDHPFEIAPATLAEYLSGSDFDCLALVLALARATELAHSLALARDRKLEDAGQLTRAVQLAHTMALQVDPDLAVRLDAAHNRAWELDRDLSRAFEVANDLSGALADTDIDLDLVHAITLQVGPEANFAIAIVELGATADARSSPDPGLSVAATDAAAELWRAARIGHQAALRAGKRNPTAAFHATFATTLLADAGIGLTGDPVTVSVDTLTNPIADQTTLTDMHRQSRWLANELIRSVGRPVTPIGAAVRRIAALCLAAEAHRGLDNAALANAFREIAAAVTMLQQRLFSDQPPDEMVVLTLD